MKEIYLSEIDSTQRYLIEALPFDGPHEGMAVYSFNQYSGKGQANKTWTSAPDAGIALSVAFPFSKDSEIDWVLMNKHLCTGVIRFLQQHVDPRFSLKWPNDVIISDRKLGGMIMNIVPKSGVQYLVLGLGLNVQQPPDLPQAIGMNEISTSKDFQLVAFTKKIIDFLLDHVSILPDSTTHQIYNSLLWKLNQTVMVNEIESNEASTNKISQKTFKGVDDYGRAIFEFNQETMIMHHGKAHIILPPINLNS